MRCRNQVQKGRLFRPLEALRTTACYTSTPAVARSGTRSRERHLRSTAGNRTFRDETCAESSAGSAYHSPVAVPEKFAQFRCQ
jgi:hypothetical protein